jgi:outer membrane protein TolC
MMKYSMLMFAIVLTVVTYGGAAQPAARPATTAPSHEVDPAIAAFMKPVEAASSDDEVRQKLKERHNTAVRLLELRVEGYRKGLNDVNQVFEAARMVVDAKHDLAQNVAERDALMGQMLEVTKAMESQLQKQFEAGIGSEADVLRARLARETVEVEMLKTKQARGAAPTTQPR